MNESVIDVSPKNLKSLFLSSGTCREEIVNQARILCKQRFEGSVLLRGIVEFSSFCRKSCAYCGLRCQNMKLSRYRLSEEEIETAVANLFQLGLRTVVLQSGEDLNYSDEDIARIIEKIKKKHPSLAITLSLGERDFREYKIWREAGADRYLLKIETRNPELYRRLHPGMSLQSRLDCIDALIDLSYQTGSGLISGLPGQNAESICDDLLYLSSKKLDMISIGPFVPHPATPLASCPAGAASESIFLLALCRLMNPGAHMPATSALAAGPEDMRSSALGSGANVIMPNCSPASAARDYDIYPHSGRSGNQGAAALQQALDQIERGGKRPDFSRGDALRLSDAPLKEYV